MRALGQPVISNFNLKILRAEFLYKWPLAEMSAVQREAGQTSAWGALRELLGFSSLENLAFDTLAARKIAKTFSYAK